MSSDGKISVDIVANEKGFTAQLDSIAATTRKAFGSLMGGLTSVLMGKGLVDTAAKAIELASAAQQTANRVNSVFPEMADTINAFASRAMTDMGMGGGAAKDMAAKFGMMAQGMGFTEKQAANMSMQMTQLAGDLAAFYGITTDEAQSRLSGVFTGMTRGLKTMGVNMSDANLQAHALALGIQQDISTMSEAQLAALRLSYAQQQLATVSGYAKQNLGTWAGQTALLRQQTNALLASMGKGLIAVFLPVLKVINAVIGGLIQVANAFNAMIERITGKKFGEMMGGAAGVTLDLSGAASSAGESTGGLADAQGRAAKAADKQDKAQRKLNRTLAGFDKITKLTSDAANKALGGTGGLGGVGGLGVDPLGFGGLVEDAQEAQQAVDGITIPPAIEKALRKLGTAFSELFDVISAAGKWAYDNVLKPLGEWTIDKLVPSLIDLLAAAFRVLAKILKGLAPIGKAVWNYFFKPLAKLAGDAIIAMIQGIAGALDALADFAGKHPKALNAIAGGLAAVFAVSKLKGAGGLAGLISKLAGKFKIFFAAITGKGGVAGLGKLGKGLVGLIKKFPIKNPLVLGLAAVVTALGFIYKNWSKIRKTKIGQAIEKLGKALEPIAGKVGQAVQKLLEKAADLGERIWKALKPIIEKALPVVLDWAEKAAEAFGDALIDAIETVTGLLEDFSDLWDGLESKDISLTAHVLEKNPGALAALAGGWGVVVSKAATLTANFNDKTGGLDKLQTAWGNIKDKVATITGKIADGLSNLPQWWADVTKTLSGKVGSIGVDVMSGLGNLATWWQGASKLIGEKAGTVTANVKSGLANIGEWWSGASKTISDKAASVTANVKSGLANIGEWWEGAKQKIVEKAASITANVKSGLGNLSEWWEGAKEKIASKAASVTANVKSGLANLSAWWNGAKAKITAKAASVTANVKSGLANVKSWWNAAKVKITSKTASVAASIRSGFNNASAWWEGVKRWAAGKVFSVAGKIQLSIGNVVSGVRQWLNNNVASRINNVINKIPGLGGVRLQFAQGGFVPANTPKLAVIGDNRREGEIVSPESKFQKMLDKAAASGGDASQLLPVLNAILAAIQSSDRGVYLDGREISRRVVRDVNAITQATGRSPIIV